MSRTCADRHFPRRVQMLCYNAMLCMGTQIKIETSVAGGGTQACPFKSELLQLLSAPGYYQCNDSDICKINMQLPPLGRLQPCRPQANGVTVTTPLPRLNKHAVPSSADSSCDIHRLLESYSRQITQTGRYTSSKCTAEPAEPLVCLWHVQHTEVLLQRDRSMAYAKNSSK